MRPAQGVKAGGTASSVLRKVSGDLGGAWCWFGDSRVVYHKGQREQTYAGWIDRQGNIKVSSWDHAKAERTTVTVRKRLQVDDHDNPALLMRHDGRLMVFYSKHSGPAMYYRVTENAEDITAFGPEMKIPDNTPGRFGFTYPNAVQLSGENDRTFLFWRGGNYNPSFATTDDGVNWSPARTLIDSPGQRPYVKYANNRKDTIGMAFTEAHPRNKNTSIYFALYRNGLIHRANGTQIGTLETLPFKPKQADVLYDATKHPGTRAWVHDTALDDQGRPTVVYAVMSKRSPVHRYRYARWDGTRWIHRDLGRAGRTMSGDGGERDYSGGITIDRDNPNRLYVSKEVRGKDRKFRYEIQRWKTRDNGRTWIKSSVTKNSSTGNYRPFSPEGSPNDQVFFMRGKYRNYEAYQTDLFMTPFAAKKDRSR